MVVPARAGGVSDHRIVSPDIESYRTAQLGQGPVEHLGILGRMPSLSPFGTGLIEMGSVAGDIPAAVLRLLPRLGTTSRLLFAVFLLRASVAFLHPPPRFFGR